MSLSLVFSGLVVGAGFPYYAFDRWWVCWICQHHGRQGSPGPPSQLLDVVLAGLLDNRGCHLRRPPSRVSVACPTVGTYLR
ncbi:hypothetical protein PspLS_10275 [Pyricularia sp. CBS 133598]|nr:hypothetical protein PspLS_10275 [Pyricularia sp. CBS 133598]